METCPTCGTEFEKIGTHWQWNPEHRPQLSDYQFELIAGLLMGDGSIQQNRGGRKPQLDLCMVNEDFLQWVDSKLGVFSTGVRLRRTGEEIEQQKTNRGWCSGDYQDQYRLLTRAHPDLWELNKWYSSGEKIFPEDLELTPTRLKMWYVTDGSYDSNRRNIRVSSVNEKHNRQKLISYFSNIGIEASWNGEHNIRVFSHHHDKFFSYVGDPPSGFEHKWPDGRNADD